jgi:hypothetical protein
MLAILGVEVRVGITSPPSEWEEYLTAARRKVEIATYHAKRLKAELDARDGPTDGMPSIPIQAHFEGVVVSVMAAVDQVAQAVNSALGLKLRPEELAEKAFSRIGREVPEMSKWYDDPIGRDLRRSRTKIVHYHYAKTPYGLSWTMQSVGRDYGGSRTLLDYATSAVDYGLSLCNLLHDVRAVLVGGGSG